MSKTQTTMTGHKAKPSLKTTVIKKTAKSPAVPGSKTASQKSTSEIKPKATKSVDEKEIKRIPVSKSSTEPKTTRKDPLAKPKLTTTTKIPKQATSSPMKTRESIEKTQIQRNGMKISKSKTDTARITKPSAAKPNAVLDTYHNVTIASPPTKRKAEGTIKSSESTKSITQPTRKNTRTLEPEEIVVLRNDSAKQRSEAEIRAQEENEKQGSVKDAVAFEVNFERPIKSRDPSKTRHKNEMPTAADAGDDSYSDDFESYESDFETGSSSPPDDNSTTDEENRVEKDANSLDEKSTTDDIEDDDNDEESELTQNPITVIQRDKGPERKLDSGNYEINSQKQLRVGELATQLGQFDSMDTLRGEASEMDSGISSYGNTTLQLQKQEGNSTVFYGGYADFNTRPIVSNRGRELMSKIQFDTLTFTLFEVKPISYDVFMQIYGTLNTRQSSTQTLENRMTTESQTDTYEPRTMWTQHPPQYDLQTVQNLGNFNGLLTQNSCGESLEDDNKLTLSTDDELDKSLRVMLDFQRCKNERHFNQQQYKLRKPIDFDKLHSFLLRSAAMVSKVLGSNSNKEQFGNVSTKSGYKFSNICEGFTKLHTQFLNALRVVRVFAHTHHHLVITVHESLPQADVYRSDFSNLLMVWSINECSKPIRLLSAWSEVCRAEICNGNSDIIVCGLRDGSVAMWDLRETHSFCSKLDGNLTHFAATQSIVPTLNANEESSTKFQDLGAVVDVKCFRSRPKPLGISNTLSGYKSTQFVTLHDAVLTVWTLVETTPNEYLTTSHPKSSSRKKRINVKAGSRFEYSSPWARVKLIQSSICDLRSFVERDILKPKSLFDTKKLLFEKNIYRDEVLQELNESYTEILRNKANEGLRFTCIDTGCESIYVCTNRNFILHCSKSLKTEVLRKITIDAGRFLFPTALRVLTNEDYLVVGLSNGSVVILNSNRKNVALLAERSQDKFQREIDDPMYATKEMEMKDSDVETGKSCAIQNIILNERRSLENYQLGEFNGDFKDRPTTAACIGLITSRKKPFELRMFDQQILLSGSILRKDLVQSLELSSDGWRLFALSASRVRVYDFYLDCEVALTDSGESKVVDMATARMNSLQQNLIVLNADNEVEVHFVKQ